VSVSGSNGGFPLLVDDRHRALVYKLFDAALHPAYAVLDHCMRYAALLPSIDVQTADNGLVTVGPGQKTTHPKSIKLGVGVTCYAYLLKTEVPLTQEPRPVPISTRRRI